MTDVCNTSNAQTIKKSDACAMAEDAANSAVRKVFFILGIDVDSPSSVEEFREDLRFGKKLRKAADHGMLAFIGVVMTALAAALWVGISGRLHP